MKGGCGVPGHGGGGLQREECAWAQTELGHGVGKVSEEGKREGARPRLLYMAQKLEAGKPSPWVCRVGPGRAAGTEGCWESQAGPQVLRETEH